jgi:outer membrane murein-binding lipoprotein Lpp
MTYKTTKDDNVESELERLRAHNATLLEELKAERAKTKAAQDATGSAKADADKWRTRFNDAGKANDMAEIKKMAKVPEKYFLSMLADMGIFKLETSDDGTERHIWYGKDGKEVNPAEFGGLGDFFSEFVHDEERGKLLTEIGAIPRAQGTGAPGSRMGESGCARIPDPPAKKPEAVAPALGLR